MRNVLQVEELVIDDSFRNYCFQKNEDDMEYWEEYINTHPAEAGKIDEAKKILFGLHAMLQQEYGPKGKTGKNHPQTPATLHDKHLVKKMIVAIVSVAAVFGAIFFLRVFTDTAVPLKKPETAVAINSRNPNTITYSTAKGEKKTIILPDSSKLHLNSFTTLVIDQDFGRSNRNVYLSGEALFDVAYHSSLPFIVQVNKYAVKVLGTVFNVRSYPGDKFSETSLIKGKVLISLENNSHKTILRPNQKAVIDNGADSILANANAPVPYHKAIAVLPLSYSPTDSIVIETAWSRNRLEIINESFSEMKDKLERW
ncbi:MAG: FecR domain-containing protein, partial [Bacteroidota bacterium]|nr:FecR domain-containing protein [Bacteroidota bacterium]